MMTREKFNLYQGEVELDFVTNHSTVHFYEAKDPKNGLKELTKVPSSTGILGVINKETLGPWHAKEAVKAAGWYEREIWQPGNKYIPAPQEEVVVGHARLLEIHGKVVKMTAEEYWAFLMECKGAAGRSREESADIGTQVHELIEKWIKTDIQTGSTFDLQHLEVKDDRVRRGFDAFMGFVLKHDVRFRNSERKVYSRKYQYAGTLDWDAEVDGILTLGDTKTSNFFSPDMFFQTASYQGALEEEFSKTKYQQNMIIRCGKDGTLEVKIQPRKEVKKDFEAFLGARALYNRKKETKNAA